MTTYSEHNAWLMQGDCLDVMSRIPDGMVNLVLCDLPYGTTEHKWDVVIPLDHLWKHYRRVTSKNSSFIFTSTQPFTSDLVLSCKDMFRYCAIWQKTKVQNFAQAPYRLLGEHEDIVIFSKGKSSSNSIVKMTYNPQGTIPVIITRNDRLASSHRANRSKQKDYTQTTTNYPKSIISIPSCLDKDKKHPTQKPTELLAYLIKTYSNEGEVVLDNTMGSGSTGVAAIITGRKFIGIERDQTYFDVACERIHATEPRA